MSPNLRIVAPAPGGVDILNGGVLVKGQATEIDFQANVTATDGGGTRADINASGGAAFNLQVYENGVLKKSNVDQLNFTGVTTVVSGGVTRANVDNAGLTVQDEGGTIQTGVTVLDVVGANINATTPGAGQADINAPPIVPPPPLGGYWGLGYATNVPGGQSGNIDRLAFATDTVAMVTAATTLAGYQGGTGFNSSLRGFFGSGRSSNVVRVMLFSAETLSNTLGITTSNTGDGFAGYNSSSYGYGSGGYSTVGGGPYRDTFRVDMASPTSTIQSRGLLTQTGTHMAGLNSSTHGYVGGDAGGALPASTTNRLTFASDTTNMITRAALSSSRQAPGAFHSTTHGYWPGGSTGSIQTTNSRITFSSDTSAQVNRGALNIGIWYGSGCNSDVKGYVAGGQRSTLAIIADSQALTFATDTTAMVTRGALTGTRWYNTACNSGGY